jgi:hypothetical protein
VKIARAWTLALLAASAPLSISSAAEPRLTAALLRDDLRVLRETFEGAHAGLYRYTPKAAMDSAFAAVDAQLTHPMGDVEFGRRLAPLIDLIHDSHTPLVLPAETRRHLVQRERVFPLDLRYDGERAFIERNVSTNRDIPVRGEILAINGRPMSEITPRVLLGRSADGFTRSAKFHPLNRNFWFYYWTLVDTAQTFRIAVRDPASGRTRNFVAAGVPADSMNRGQFSTQRHDSLALEFFQRDSTALLTIPTLGDTALNAKFRGSFAEIRRRGSTSLILDLRDNSGGIDEFNTSLLDYLIDHPYRFYRGFTFVARDTMQLRYTEHTPRDFMGDEDAVRLTPAQWEIAYRMHSLPELIERVNATNLAAGVHGPVKANGFAGRLYVLVNGGSASSAAEVPALLHFLGVGTIAGEETNGCYQGVTAGILLRLVLPHSGIRTIVPLIAYHNAVLPGTFEGRGTQPDFYVPQTLEDALADRDTALEFTLQLIRSRRTPF